MKVLPSPVGRHTSVLLNRAVSQIERWYCRTSSLVGYIQVSKASDSWDELARDDEDDEKFDAMECVFLEK